MYSWPKDTMAEKVKFYGDPRGPHGVDSKWYNNNLVRVVPPWKMFYAGKPIQTILIHKKCSNALIDALKAIWTGPEVNKNQAIIEHVGLQEYGGSFNYRLIRGSSALSNHSFGIAIDIAPSGNALGVTKGKMPPFAVKAFKDVGARWGGDYKGRKDWMHFEFVSAT